VRPREALQPFVALLSPLALPATLAWAQAAPTPRRGGAADSGNGASSVAMVVFVLGVLVIVGVGVKLYDLRRRRQSEAVWLQVQISDALMREQSLFGLPIITMARAPLWRGSPATIEVAGQVPSPQARETALRIVRAEAGRIRSDFQIEDRLAVVPPRAA
jgi:hypothetical protein